MRSPVEVISCWTLVADKIWCIPHGVPTGEDVIVSLYARQENCKKLFVMQMENVFFSEHPSCHRRAITLNLAAYTSLRQVLDKKQLWRCCSSVMSWLLECVVALGVLLLILVIGLRLFAYITLGVCRCSTSMKGKTVIITGANSGMVN